MAFKMTFNKEQLSGIKPVPAGLYWVRFETFKPKMSKEGNSKNFNAWCYVTNNPDYEEGKRLIIANLNEQIGQFIQDFVHSFGLPMEDDGIPGIFDADPNIFNENDLSTWRYAGPLTNKVAQWELGVKQHEGRDLQTIRRFICAVPACAETYPDVRHATDMAKKG